LLLQRATSFRVLFYKDPQSASLAAAVKLQLDDLKSLGGGDAVGDLPHMGFVKWHDLLAPKTNKLCLQIKSGLSPTGSLRQTISSPQSR